jgi:hypothetical protein
VWVLQSGFVTLYAREGLVVPIVTRTSATQQVPFASRLVTAMTYIWLLAKAAAHVWVTQQLASHNSRPQSYPDLEAFFGCEKAREKQA